MGCDYRDQLRDKMRTTRKLLYPFLAPDANWLPPFQCPQPGFRNKAKMVISGSRNAIILGAPPTSRYPHGVDLEDCPLYPHSIRVAFTPIREWLLRLGARPYQIESHRGELRHVVISANPSGELMIRLVLRSKAALKRVENTWAELAMLVPKLRVFSVNIQPEHTALIDGPEEIVLSPERFLRMPGVGTDLFVAPGAFFQTNTAGALAMYSQAAAWARQLRPSLVWDLYCGVGGFGFALADALGGFPTGSLDASPGTCADSLNAGTVEDKTGGTNQSCQVIGVELAGAAIEGAKHAVKLQREFHEPKKDDRAVHRQAVQERPSHKQARYTRTGREKEASKPNRRFASGRNENKSFAGSTRTTGGFTSELRFITADAGKWIKNQKKMATPDLLVVNPPRRGLGSELSKWIEQSGIPHVIYSSCYQPSLVDNLHRMKSYRVTELKLVDMFPQTHHVESVVLMSKTD